MIALYNTGIGAYGASSMTPFNEAEYQRQYRQQNAARIKEQARLRKLADPSKVAAQKHADYVKHADAYKARAKAHRLANADRIKSLRSSPEYKVKRNALRRSQYVPHPAPPPMTKVEKRAKAREWYQNNKARCSTIKKTYYRANKALWRKMRSEREYWQNRYTRGLKAAGIKRTDVADREGLQTFYREIFTKPEATCTYCAGVFPVKAVTIDHVVPFKSGGKHEVSNLSVACFKCNSTKGAMAISDWLEYRKTLT